MVGPLKYIGVLCPFFLNCWAYFLSNFTRVFCQNDVNGIANSEDLDQTALSEQPDLGLHCLPRPFCPKI